MGPSCHSCVLTALAVCAAPGPFARTAAATEADRKEIEYVFAGMRQERDRMRTGSCVIDGADPVNGPFRMTYLMKGDSIRFTRTHTATEPPRVVKGCDNGQTIAFWDVAAAQCMISRSTPPERETLYAWDPRLTGFVLIAEEADYRKVLDFRRETWAESATVRRDGPLRSITFVKPLEFQDIRITLTVNVEHGFTPVSYRADTAYKPNSNFPGRVEVYYEVTAKWAKVDDVWVPTHHRHTTGDEAKVDREYKLSWEWVNRAVDDREFTLAGLGVPADVPRVDFRSGSGRAVGSADPAPAPAAERPRAAGWARLAGAATGAALLAAAVWAWWRRAGRAEAVTEAGSRG